MTETLFGGLLFAALLFFAARRFGLPNFWAGFLSGALPFLLYLAYSYQHWSGGDVLAMHFAVFLANASLLTVFGDMQQKKRKLHWAPRLIIAFFVGLVLLNAILLTIANRGLPDMLTGLLLPPSSAPTRVHTAFPGVIPHDRNKSYQPHLQQLERQRDAGWKVELYGLQSIKPQQLQLVSLHLHDKDNLPVTGADPQLAMWRMANSRDDRRLHMQETEPGLYQAEIRLADPGRWLAELQIRQGDFIYRKQQQIFVDE